MKRLSDLDWGRNVNVEPVELFCIHADADESLCIRLEKHLSVLRREGLIATWSRRQIISGMDWKKMVDHHLNTASVILLLISSDFLASDYCYGVEMRHAMARHEAGEVLVIPILLRLVDNWQGGPFGDLKALPSNGIPVTRWSDRDAAFTDIARGLRNVLQENKLLPMGIPAVQLPKTIWNVPHPRNAFFTGRESILQYLADAWKHDQSTRRSHMQAISGLGGIGKTHIAVEYAYLHQHDYQAVLWALADTRESLISGYLAIAQVLNLPEKCAEAQQTVIQAVKMWLQTHDSWLLILDNADNLSLANEFLPSTFEGHLLITTRAQATGTRIHCTEVDTMTQDVGALFLLHRAKLTAINTEINDIDSHDLFTAYEICKELGGLPLALDQAGAFIESAQCSLQDYYKLYQTRRMLLLKRRGDIVSDHPEPVATTWSLSFEMVEQRSPIAVDLLRLCALLHSDAIPMELVAQGMYQYLSPDASMTKDDVTLNDAIATLRAYSLVRRNAKEKMLSLHRLVQTVIRDTMDKPTRRLWAERVVHVVNSTFPEVSFTTWSLCERYLSHALACAELAEQEQIIGLEAARLFYRVGYYLLERARVSEAYSLLQQSLIICEQQLGPEHVDTASTVDLLARYFRIQGKYTESESFYMRALSIREKQLGANHPDTATILNNLALLYKMLGKYAESELLYARALSIREQQLGSRHSDTAQSLNDLASLYWNQGKHKQAEVLFQRALSIREQVLGPEHPDTAQSMWWLASIYKKHLQEYDKAEPLYQRALSIYERALGSEHPYTQKVRRGYISLLKTVEEIKNRK